MSAETATSVTDLALALGTFALALSIGKRKTERTWSALFILLSIAAGVGSMYHGIERLHTLAFWTVVSTSSAAAAFMFLAVCVCLSKPQWKWLSWTWPAFAVAGILVGGFLAPAPFWYLSVVAGLCMLLSLLVLPYSPSKRARNWIYAGVGMTMAGLAAQRFVTGTGLLNHNAVFHELQLAGNFFLWRAAKNSP